MATSRAGFSLLEVMVALSILFLALAPVYPILYGHYQTVQLEQEADRLASLIEEVRQETSMRQHKVYIILSYNEYPHSYYVTINNQAERIYYLPETISLHKNYISNRLSFNYYGVPVAAGTISLTTVDGKQKEIIIHPFSGIVEIR